MKNKMILILSLVVLVFLLVGPVWATATGTINVTVTPKLIALSVGPTSYDYGVLELGAQAETDATFTVTNEGTVNEDFQVKGQDTAGGWSLASTNTIDNQYIHEWKEVGQTYGKLTTVNQPAATGVAASSGTKDFKFRITLPSVSDVSGVQDPKVIFTATES